MLLRNLKLVDSQSVVDIDVVDGKINSVGRALDIGEGGDIISFDNAIGFPGLVNSHDHLDFNLFPQLGDKLYNNYVEWGNHIHTYNKGTISKVLAIPNDLRVKWGLYKNLLNGVTTVVNHGPLLEVDNNLITVFQQYHLLHSIQLEKYWKYLLNKPFKKKQPFVIHIGEGGDISCSNEIDNLQKWNLCKRDIVGVHGIAMKEHQAASFKALVWCPDSNFFLIGKTAPIMKLKSRTDILFGTDSTLSARWNLWDHLRLAKGLNIVTDNELYKMLTVTAAKVWNLPGCGKIESGYSADIVVAKQKPGLDGFGAFYALNPEDILLVTHKGNIRLFDAGLLEQVNKNCNLIGNFSKIVINGAVKYVYGDVPGLMRQIRGHYNAVNFPVAITEN